MRNSDLTPRWCSSPLPSAPSRARQRAARRRFGQLLALAAGISCRPASPPAALPAPEPPAAASDPAAGSPLPSPPATPDAAPALPALERMRLEYALESAQLLARDWPWMRADETCVLLIAPGSQWVVNCPSCPEKFGAAGPPLFGEPVCGHAGDTISFNGQSLPTAAFVQAVPATANVPLPGEGTAAPGSDRPWLIASSLDALIGSHPAFNAQTTTEEWLSIFLHEFFHTRQMLVPSFRATLAELKSGQLDPGALEKAFREDAEYRSLVEQEYQILSAAAARDAGLSAEAARGALAQWSALYARRREQLRARGGDQLVRADVALTYVEGTARYVEARFSMDPRLHASASLEADPHFHHYQTFPGAPGYGGLPQRKLGPRYFYAIGLHLSLLLDRADPSWKSRVSEQQDWLVGLAQSLARGLTTRRGSAPPPSAAG